MKRLLWCASLILVLTAAAVHAVPVTDGLIIHLQADSLSLADGAAVSSWPDSAPAGADGTVSTATGIAVPTYKTNAINGMPAVKFVKASKQALSSAEWNWDKYAGTCVFIVATGGGNFTIQRAVQVGSYSGSNQSTFAAEFSPIQSGCRYGSGFAGLNGPFASGDWHVSIRQIESTGGRYDSLFYAINDTKAMTLTAFTNPDTLTDFYNTRNTITVGNGKASSTWRTSDWYDGYIAEVLVYNAILTQSQMQQTMSYLTDKYFRNKAINPSVTQGTPSGGSVAATLSWNTALDATFSAPNPNVTKHYLRMRADDPNLNFITPIEISAGSPIQATASYGPTTLLMDKTYYWRIDESINNSAPGDPNTIKGFVWSFESAKSVPNINVQPVNQTAESGASASLSIDVSSPSALTYAWYKSLDSVNDTPLDDLSVGTNSATLPFPLAASTDEGYYFCKVTNVAGTVYSDVAKFGVKRLAAHWTLDLADYNGSVGRFGTYLDSAEDHNADANDTPAFVSGVDPSETFEGLDLVSKPLAVADANNWDPAEFTDAMTLSAWIKCDGVTPASNQGIVSKNDSVKSWYWMINTIGTMVFNCPSTNFTVDFMPYVDSWTHVVISAEPAQTILYIDGKPAFTGGPYLRRLTAATIKIGANTRTGAALSSIFNGTIDDVRIYSYAMDQYQIAQLYYDVLEKGACLNPENVGLKADVAGPDGSGPDCIVGWDDFIKLASEWLNCGYYPQIDCP